MSGYDPAPWPPVVLSAVVPVRNEAPNILPLVGELRAALAAVSARHGVEIVYVDDASEDETRRHLAEAVLLSGAPLLWLRHRRPSGQSAAIATGIGAAVGDWIATLDGDGQNDPADIPALFDLAGVYWLARRGMQPEIPMPDQEARS